MCVDEWWCVVGGYVKAKKLQRSKNAGETTSANFKYGIAPRLDWPRSTQGDISLDTSVSCCCSLQVEDNWWFFCLVAGNPRQIWVVK